MITHEELSILLLEKWSFYVLSILSLVLRASHQCLYLVATNPQSLPWHSTLLPVGHCQEGACGGRWIGSSFLGLHRWCPCLWYGVMSPAPWGPYLQLARILLCVRRVERALNDVCGWQARWEKERAMIHTSLRHGSWFRGSTCLTWHGSATSVAMIILPLWLISIN